MYKWDKTNLDGSTELGEGRGRLGLLDLLIGAGALLLLAKGKRQRALALFGLHLLLGLAVGDGSDLDGLSGDGGRRGNLGGERLGGLDSGDHRGGLSDSLGGRSLLGGRRSLRSSRSLLLAEGEVTEDALKTLADRK